MKKALFLDRDGIINVEKNYVYRIEDFEFLEGIFELVYAAQEKGYLPIIITNQAGIARGFYTEDDFIKLTKWMLNEFSNQGISIAKVYHCPFHPVAGVGSYKVDSPDRKPRPGMIFRAQDEFKLDLTASILVGDKQSDIEAGQNAGVGKLVLLNSNLQDFNRQKVNDFSNLSEIKCFLFNQKERLF